MLNTANYSKMLLHVVAFLLVSYLWADHSFNQFGSPLQANRPSLLLFLWGRVRKSYPCAECWYHKLRMSKCPPTFYPFYDRIVTLRIQCVWWRYDNSQRTEIRCTTVQVIRHLCQAGKWGREIYVGMPGKLSANFAKTALLLKMFPIHRVRWRRLTPISAEMACTLKKSLPLHA